MWFYITKVVVSAVVIVVISELAKRSSVFGAIMASVPLISVIAIIWLYQETGDVTKISILASNIFWLVLPSLALFITLPILLNMGVHFYWSLLLAVCTTVICYYFMLVAYGHLAWIFKLILLFTFFNADLGHIRYLITVNVALIPPEIF